MAFAHLHVHTQYSILDGHSAISNLFERAEELGQPGLAITDHGYLYGIKEFLKYADKHPSVKPVLGCETYVSLGDHRVREKGYYHLILLAKNYTGYKNLMKIASIARIEGFYSRPRVSHEVLEKYHEGLICSSACIAGEIPRKILAGDIEGASEAIEWHKKVFGDDYYLEVMLHKTEVPGMTLELYERQQEVNRVIFELAEKHGVKVIATNDVHFVRKEDGPAHDRLICVSTNDFVDDPKRLRYTQQEYLKSEEEMLALFPDHPEAISNTMEVLDKVERYSIDRGHVLPRFELPQDFLDDIDAQLEKYEAVIAEGRNDENGEYRGDEFCRSVAYLCNLTCRGARRRYGDVLNDEQLERIDFELKTISRMGFPDYFLIVQDFIAWARNNGISVGPGRGSAAGSVVAYCLGITNLDPIRYDLLFERFLNPERISMPDIDVDFDDEGRYRVIKYVQEKYGVDHVSHVITFGTMAAKSAIKDVARISHMGIEESNRLTKLVPDRPFKVVETTETPYNEGDTLADGETLIEKNGARFKVKKEEKDYKPTLKNCLKFSEDFQKEYNEGDPLVQEVLRYAMQLEGSIRQVGIHACAMIIGRGDLTDYIPVTIGYDKATGQDVWVSQYEGSYIEEVGMLKMDFLGLKTLSIIKECLADIKKSHGEDIDIESIPLDDPLTYELYGRGDTKSVFQFESPGMKEWLVKLHPQRIEDLIAMNALYRPGPMDYIPNFVARKRGEEPITYDLPDMEEFLAETYGVTVYQEQVMLLSRKLAGFSRGKADKLRKAMGKKQLATLEALYGDFEKGGLEHGYSKEILDKIWKDWRAFAEYAFNKSHATCYAWVSYQTGWLKAHYPAEFQAANLSQNLNNMDELKSIMDDCKKNRITVLGPDVNESDAHFTVNKDGNIRFGLGGMKGFGSNVVDAIISEREQNGPFKDLFDFVERNGMILNRKSLESLVFAGALDSFGYQRSRYFVPVSSDEQFIDALVRYAGLYSKDTLDANNSLFGDSEDLKPVRPVVPEFNGEENEMFLLQQEKELVGLYISSHPLDKYSFQMKTFTNCELGSLIELIGECENKQETRSCKVAGIVTDCKMLVTKTGKPMSKCTLEDFSGSYEFTFFSEDHERFISYMQLHNALLIDGTIKARYRLRPEELAAGKKASFALKVNSMMLLGNACDAFVKGLSVTVSSTMLGQSFTRELVALLKRHPGNIPLTIFINDPKTHYTVEFLSKKFSVDVNTELLDGLSDLGLRYQVNLKK